MSPKHLHRYVGNLELYFETGMEQMAAIFHDDRGLHEGPKWDKPEEKMMYKSLSWAIFFGDRFCMYDIKIFNKDGTIAYEGPLVKDKGRIRRANYNISFIPTTITRRKWVDLCQRELRAELTTNQLTDAIKQEYKIQFDTGTTVKDSVSNRDALIVGHALKEDKTFKYLVAHIENGRLPPTYFERETSTLTTYTFKDFKNE